MNLLFFAVILVAGVSQISCGSSDIRYDVPEPSFEVFSPKGVRISIPDSREVEEVEFAITIPGIRDPIVSRSKSPERGYWSFWDPNAVVHQYEKIHYKITVVHHVDMFCSREGVHVVQKVVPLGGQADVGSDQYENQKVLTGFPSLDQTEHHAGRLTSGKSSNFKSSYSLYKNSDLKPITKSTTSTTSGTFYLKPSGVVEASGYKEGSSYDSTKNEGQQWEHYRSELTAEELEKMRQNYGSGFHDLDVPGKLFPGIVRNLDKSYFASEFQNFPAASHKVQFGDASPVKTEFRESHQTHESSSYSHSGRPALRFQFDDSADSSSRFNSQINGQIRPNSPSNGAIEKTIKHEEHAGPTRIRTQSEKTIRSNEYSHQDQRELKPVYQGSATIHSSNVEFSSENLGRIENREDGRSRTQNDNIFTSFKSDNPRHPQECVLAPDYDYRSSGTIREVEKFARELSCLASVAETTMKREISELKEKNSYFQEKLSFLEKEMRRLMNSCKCH